MTGPYRLPRGGRIERGVRLAFTFDGRNHSGHPGDTLASALLAAGVQIVGRSFKYHRPRGVFSAGSEEPNALVSLRTGERAEPNTRATMVPLFEGLQATSQNRWPSLGLDLMAIADSFSPLLPAGFYYKTFMWSRQAWQQVEGAIRRSAGLGIAPQLPDPDRYEQQHAHCDVLVVGGGPAGLAAATAALRAGASVMLVDEHGPELGGQLRDALPSSEDSGDAERIGALDAAVWVAERRAELDASPRATILTLATAYGYYDDNLVALVERVADHLPVPAPLQPRQRLWLVQARRVVFATGAIERPLVFADNDRPGVLLAGAARTYASRFGVAAGRNVVVYANHAAAYQTVLDLQAAGVRVVALIDSRPVVAPAGAGAFTALADGAIVAVQAVRVRAGGTAVFPGHAVIRAHGARAVAAVSIAPIDGAGRVSGSVRRLACDAVCVSGGWVPTVHLHSQAGGRLTYDEAIAAFVPGAGRQAHDSVGAAAGQLTLAACLRSGFAGGAAAAAACCLTASGEPAHTAAEPPPEWTSRPEVAALPRPLWVVAEPGASTTTRAHSRRRGKHFIDFQDDVTLADLALAHREGYRAVEHLKRYTTLGMGTDQGKTSNLNGLSVMAQLRSEPIPAVGATTFRPPYTPVTLGSLVGARLAEHLEPVRRTPLHDWHEAHGAQFLTVGHWLRPGAYQAAGEDYASAWRREVLAVRHAVGLCDVSTLGKIDVQGPDALALLEWVYCNNWASLKVGRARYGLMLREDGLVFDDGTTARLADQHYYMTTTTANAAAVMARLEYVLQVERPELRAQVATVSDQYAQLCLAGPLAQRALAAVAPALDLSAQALPHMGCARVSVAGIPAMVFRLSFSGECAYEIAVPAHNGRHLWEQLLAAGAPFRITPYGTEALGALRIEKGHVAGPELDGTTTPFDLRLEKLVSQQRPFTGAALLARAGLRDEARPSLIGLVPVSLAETIPAGAQLLSPEAADDADNDSSSVGIPLRILGRTTSVTYSPTLGHSIALGLLTHGRSALGRELIAASPLTGQAVSVRVVAPTFYDPEGSRLHGA